MVEKMVKRLNEIIINERTHFNFYLQASLVVKGMERLYLKPLFEKEMMSELEHIREFGDKVVALGGTPATESLSFYQESNDGKDLLSQAIIMELQVLQLYHELYPFAEEYAQLHNDKSIMLLLEDNIEHTTKDMEEMKKIWLY